VINTNSHVIWYCFEVSADYCSHFGHSVLSPTPLRDLGATYTVHLRLTGKLVVCCW